MNHIIILQLENFDKLLLSIITKNSDIHMKSLLRLFSKEHKNDETKPTRNIAKQGFEIDTMQSARTKLPMDYLPDAICPHL